MSAELDLSQIEGRIAWPDVFGNDNPVEIDIGCGRGRYIIEAAMAHPEINYLGVEVAGRPYHLAVNRVEKRAIPNAKAVRTDAREFVADRIADGSVSVVHVLFPDPWPKKRHHKRRVVTPLFVEGLARILAPDGSLHIATDIADYFDELLVIIESTALFRATREGRFDPDRDFLTNFAAKYLDQGREMYEARLVPKRP